MEKKSVELIHKVLVNIVRYLVASVFIFSGFVKIVDPLGFVYKLQDYVAAIDIHSIPQFIFITGALSISAVEFIIGIYLFFGVRRRISSFLSLVLMCFMTPLTFILAITNPISDCGCFGDALVLTNWQTFWKNVVLLGLIIYLYKHNRKIIRFFSIETNWIVSLYSIFYVFALGIYCLVYLPILDFRPFKIGTDIVKEMSIPEGAEEPIYDTYYIMEKDGVQKQFSLENYPDSTWSFVDAKTELIYPGYIPKIQNFTITDIETGEDFTDSILLDTHYNFILVAHRIDHADDSNIDLINEIYDYSKNNNYNFICLTSSPVEDILEWQDKTGANYQFYHSDDITLKTIIRSNPGLLLMKDGVIYNKWDHYSLPDEFVLNAPLNQIDLGEIQYRSTKYIIGAVVGWYFVPLLIIFGLDKIYLAFKRRKEKYKK